MTTPSITTVFNPPLPTDSRAEFDAKAFDTVSKLNAWATEANALATAVDEVAVTAASASDSATDAAAAAEVTKTQTQAIADEAQDSADAAAASAASALNAPGTSATSTTSLAIGTGSKAFTIQTGKAFVVGQFVVAANAANVTDYMFGQISAHNSGTGALTINVTAVSGSGTFANWSIGLSASGAGDVTLTNKTIEAGTFTNGYTEEVATANTSTAYTIDLAGGSVQILTLTGNCTFTFPTATAGQSFILLLKQDGTGGRTVTWPAAVKWPGGTAPTITSTASKMDKFVFTAADSNWYGSVAGQNYTV
jgi:hypothetical protein